MTAAPETLFDVVLRNAQARPDAPALMSENGVVSFGEIAERVDRMMGFISAAGWRPGDIVGVAIADEPLHLVASLAALALGAAHIGLPAYETAAASRTIVERLGVRLILTDRRLDWADGLKVVETSLAALSAAPRAAGLARAGGDGKPAIYIKTSGSTEVPKTFAITYARVRQAVGSFAERSALERCVMRTSSIDFDSTRFYRIHALLAGYGTVFAPRDMGRLGAVCARFDVSHVHIGTYRLASMLAGGAAVDPLPATTSIFTGGSRVSAQLRQETIARLSPILYVSYATSEAGRISTAMPDQHADWPEGVGFAEKDVVIEIVDADDAPVAPGEIGLIRVKTAFQPTGYVGQGAAASQFRGGWFYPNDLGAQPDGAPLIYHGRSDDVMLLNGVKVSGTAIEDLMAAHPDVREAVAYAMPSRLHGEIPAVAVVLNEHARGGGGDGLLDYGRKALGVRGPRRVVVLDEIPRTVTGKPIKRDLQGL